PSSSTSRPPPVAAFAAAATPSPRRRRRPILLHIEAFPHRRIRRRRHLHIPLLLADVASSSSLRTRPDPIGAVRWATASGDLGGMAFDDGVAAWASPGGIGSAPSHGRANGEAAAGAAMSLGLCAASTARIRERHVVPIRI
ncbi:unnamed protein product, partial [Urochloa humidicola]